MVFIAMTEIDNTIEIESFNILLKVVVILPLLWIIRRVFESIVKKKYSNK